MRGRRVHAPLCGTCVVLALAGAMWPAAVQAEPLDLEGRHLRAPWSVFPAEQGASPRVE